MSFSRFVSTYLAWFQNSDLKASHLFLLSKSQVTRAPQAGSERMLWTEMSRAPICSQEGSFSTSCWACWSQLLAQKRPKKLPKAAKNVTNSGHNKAVCTIYESCLSWFSCSGHFCAYAPSQKCKKCENMKTPLKSRKTFTRNNTNTEQSGHNYSMHNFDWFSRTGMWMEGILRRRLKSSEQDNKTGSINLTWL